MNAKKIVVALSGGVDSAVSALLLKQAGHSLVSVYLKNFDIKSWITDGEKNEKIDSACSSITDQKNAERVANFLGIPFYVLNFEREYKKYVFSKFINGYKKGITPNPDVWCNTYIKFGKLLDFCQKIDPECMLATGHYARLRREIGNRQTVTKPVSSNGYENRQTNFDTSIVAENRATIQLFRGVDEGKDQSYFLWQLNQKQLRKIIFPIGDMLKSQVREIAMQNKLPNALKKDSQGICFVGKLPVKEFLKSIIKPKVGEILLSDGTKVGKHDGAYFYTIGERVGIDKIKDKREKIKDKEQRLKIFGPNCEPLYVIEKNTKNNSLTVAPDDSQAPLWRKEFEVKDVSWIGKPPGKNELLTIEIRYHQNPKSSGKISELPIFNSQFSNKFQSSQPKADPPLAENSKTYIVRLNEPVRAVTPGQHVVIYHGDEVLGGAIISK